MAKAIKLQFLLSQSRTEQVDSQLLSIINTLGPFVHTPLKVCPPIELISNTHQTNYSIIWQPANQSPSFLADTQLPKGYSASLMEHHSSFESVSSASLLQHLDRYVYLVIVGELILIRGLRKLIEDKFLHRELIQKSHLDFEQQVSEEVKQANSELANNSYKYQPAVLLLASPKSYCIRVHTLWLEEAQRDASKQRFSYVRQILMSTKFFSHQQMTFGQVQQLVKSAQIVNSKPNATLMSQGEVPHHLYIVADGEAVALKTVDFKINSREWLSVKQSLQRGQECSQLINLFVQDQQSNQQPSLTLQKDLKSSNSTVESICFHLHLFGKSSIICGPQMLSESKLLFSLKTPICCTFLRFRYVDIYQALSANSRSKLRCEKMAATAQLIQNSPKDSTLPAILSDSSYLRRMFYSTKYWEQTVKPVLKHTQSALLQSQLKAILSLKRFFRVSNSQQQSLQSQNRPIYKLKLNSQAKLWVVSHIK